MSVVAKKTGPTKASPQQSGSETKPTKAKNSGGEKSSEKKSSGPLQKLHDIFHTFARHASTAMGSATAFVLAAAAIVIWAVTGPMFGFSETWQLVINTGTTIVTFLMVFLIQHTQNHDAEAIHTKLDELLRAHQGAHNDMIDLENLSEEELEAMHERVKAAREERYVEEKEEGAEEDEE